MGNRRKNFGRLAIGGGLMLLLLVSGGAYADALGNYVGLDLNGDFACDATNEMNIIGMTMGDTVEVDIFWDNTGETDGLLSMNCTVCIQDKEAISLENPYYSSEIPGTWTATAIANSIDSPGQVGVDAWLVNDYPQLKCWLFQATDFTFSAPLAAGQHVLGTLAFRAARSGNLGMHIDGDPTHTGWFTAGFLSGGCTAGEPQDAACQCVNDKSVSVEEDVTWGSVKALFR